MSWSDFDYDNEHEELNLTSEQREIAQLGLAMTRNDIETFAKLLETPGKDFIKSVDERGETLIHRAIKLERHEIFDLLLQTNGAPINNVEINGWTPLLFSIYQDKEEFALKLINHGADINLRKKCNSTALHASILKNFHRVTPLLIDKGIDVNARDADKATPIIVLFYYNYIERRIEMLNKLLKHGADVFLQDERGYTALDLAARKNFNEATEILFTHMIQGGRVDKFNIFISTFCNLMKMKSPVIFPEIFQHVDKLILEDEYDYDICFTEFRFFEMFGTYENDHLKIFIDKFRFVIDGFLNSNRSFWDSYRGCPDYEADFRINENFADNLLVLLNDKEIAAKLAQNLNETSDCYLGDVINNAKNLIPYEKLSQILLILLNNGYKVYDFDIDIIYKLHDFSDLFEKLLHEKLHCRDGRRELMPLLIYNPQMTVNKFLKHPSAYEQATIERIFSYFATSQLRHYILEHSSGGENYEIAKQNAEALPDVPSLLELSRDALRASLVRNFAIKTYSQLEKCLNKLNLPRVCQDILLYKRSLY